MQSRQRIISTVALIAVSAGLTTVALQNFLHAPVTAAHFSPMASPMQSFPNGPPPPSSQSIELAMGRTGLNPHTLAAAGVSGNGVAAIVEDVRDFLIESGAELSAADANLALARQSAEQLQRRIQSGHATPQDLASFAAVQSNQTTASETQAQSLNTLFSAAMSSASEGARTVLQTIRSNRHWNLPAQYLVVNRTQSQWVQLRDALDHERIATAEGQSPDGAAQTFLEQVRGDSAVITATANLGANLNSVTLSLQTALAEP